MLLLFTRVGAFASGGSIFQKYIELYFLYLTLLFLRYHTVSQRGFRLWFCVFGFRLFFVRYYCDVGNECLKFVTRICYLYL